MCMMFQHLLRYQPHDEVMQQESKIETSSHDEVGLRLKSTDLFASRRDRKSVV